MYPPSGRGTGGVISIRAKPTESELPDNPIAASAIVSTL